MEINIVLEPGARKPERAHPFDAGMDIFAKERVVIKPWHHASVDSGVRIQIPEGYVGLFTSKSGLAKIFGITCHGTIDSHYTGTIKPELFNHSFRKKVFNPGDKLTQLVIFPCELPTLNIVEKLPETDRGENGFGSSGF